ncbi:hypothetical protein H5410_002966 [Solanum commersonii]|uniref:Uncharacterized protein n=1 Tax=Solanum commersonii TaxID=4109 RepID=A0A9J6B3G7_SOLCO|nr:hypothetical protein H5410_002966 [Solanum commersonii]
MQALEIILGNDFDESKPFDNIPLFMANLVRHLSTFVELQLAVEAGIVNLSIFDNGISIEEQSKDTNRQKGTK